MLQSNLLSSDTSSPRPRPRLEPSWSRVGRILIGTPGKPEAVAPQNGRAVCGRVAEGVRGAGQEADEVREFGLLIGRPRLGELDARQRDKVCVVGVRGIVWLVFMVIGSGRIGKGAFCKFADLRSGYEPALIILIPISIS